MKAEKYTLVSESVRGNTIARISEIPCDGKVTVTIGASGSKSSRQRALQWKLYTEIAQAGIGGKHEDTKEGVALVVKYRWVLPILIRDDPNFAELYTAWADKYKGKDDFRMLWFVKTQVHTEALTTSQMSEVLSEVYNYYGNMVNLTHPEDRGLLDG